MDKVIVPGYGCIAHSLKRIRIPTLKALLQVCDVVAREYGSLVLMEISADCHHYLKTYQYRKFRALLAYYARRVRI